MARVEQARPQPFDFRRNFVWNTGGSLVYFGCQWLTTVVVVLLSDGFGNAGSLGYAMAIGNIFAPVALFSVRVYQVSDTNDRYSAANYVVFRLCTIGAAAVIALSYLFVTTGTRALVTASLVFLLFKTDECFVDVLYGIEQKNKRMDFIGKSQLLRGVASLGSFGALLWFLGSLNYAIIGMFASCALVTLLYDLRKARLFGKLMSRSNRVTLFGLAKACFPIMVTSFFLMAVVALARQFFGLAYGNDDLGIYASIATPAVIIQAGAMYLYSPALVTMAERYGSGDHDGVTRTFRKIAALLALAILVVGAVLTVGGHWLLPAVFGAEVSPHLSVLPFAIAGVGLAGILGFVVAALVIMRSYKWMLLAGAVCFASCVSATPFLINRFYMNGINLGLILGNALGLVVGLVGLFKGARTVTVGHGAIRA